jgi:hypothetical protein
MRPENGSYREYDGKVAGHLAWLDYLVSGVNVVAPAG